MTFASFEEKEQIAQKMWAQFQQTGRTLHAEQAAEIFARMLCYIVDELSAEETDDGRLAHARAILDEQMDLVIANRR